MSNNTYQNNELISWTKSKISDLLGSNIETKLIQNLISSGSLYRASPSAKSKFNDVYKSIFGENYNEIQEYAKFQDQLLLRITNPIMTASKQNKTNKKMNQKNLKVAKDTAKYKILLNAVQNIKEPGRQVCDCLAQTCELINNCTTCGNIVCVQQGAGPCIFCGELVATKEQFEFFKTNTNKAKDEEEKCKNKSFDGNKMPVNWREYYNMNFFITKPQLYSSKRTKILRNQNLESTKIEKAIEHKNKLLNYDQTVTKRTKVVDSQQDYYTASESTWLSESEKFANKKLADLDYHEKHKSRLEHYISLDLKNEKAYDEEDERDRLMALENRMQE